MKNNITKEEMINYLEANGWTTLWLSSHWVKEKWIEHSGRRIKKTGYDLETAYNKCLIEKTKF